MNLNLFSFQTKTTTSWLLVLLALPYPGAAQSTQPALIDCELLFGDPEISGGQLSPDGRLLSFIKPYNGTRNIWVKGIKEPFASARPMTNDQARNSWPSTCTAATRKA